MSNDADSEALFAHVRKQTDGLITIERRPPDGFVILLHEGFPVPSDLPTEWVGLPVAHRVLDKPQFNELRNALGSQP